VRLLLKHIARSGFGHLLRQHQCCAFGLIATTLVFFSTIEAAFWKKAALVVPLKLAMLANGFFHGFFLFALCRCQAKSW